MGNFKKAAGSLIYRDITLIIHGFTLQHWTQLNVFSPVWGNLRDRSNLKKRFVSEYIDLLEKCKHEILESQANDTFIDI